MLGNDDFFTTIGVQGSLKIIIRTWSYIRWIEITLHNES